MQAIQTWDVILSHCFFKVQINVAVEMFLFLRLCSQEHADYKKEKSLQFPLWHITPHNTLFLSCSSIFFSLGNSENKKWSFGFADKMKSLLSNLLPWGWASEYFFFCCCKCAAAEAEVHLLAFSSKTLQCSSL